MPGATGGMLSSRQWTTWGGTDRATLGFDFPVSGKGARPSSGRTGEVPFGLEASVELEAERRRLHPTTLVYFRQRLIEHAKADVAMRAVLAALQKEGLIPKRSKQRLDSTHVLSAVSDLSALECVRETLRLALEELGRELAKSERPDFWQLFWERYVESKLDYKSGQEVLKNKHGQAGEDCLRLFEWLEPMAPELRYGQQVESCAKFSLSSI